METKELIQEAALDLFSHKGFDSSSVRDIAAKTGIRDSSLYFHFKNKQAILDSLMDRYIQISRQMMDRLEEGLGHITAMDDKHFYAVTEQYIRYFFLDPFISRMIMLMNHERSHNDRIRDQYVRWCIEKPLAFQTMVMKKLLDIGYLEGKDPAHIALEYYSPIFLYFSQYMNHSYTEKEKERFRKAVMSAAQSFLVTYRKGN
nr:TetR/AcrR family transcriptional regulator [uncultured Eisenbergiella sp.]